MGNEDYYKQLESRFNKLDEEGKYYILGILQALVFAQFNQGANITQSEDKDDEGKNE